MGVTTFPRYLLSTALLTNASMFEALLFFIEETLLLPRGPDGAAATQRVPVRLSVDMGAFLGRFLDRVSPTDAHAGKRLAAAALPSLVSALINLRDELADAFDKRAKGAAPPAAAAHPRSATHALQRRTTPCSSS
jgi:hypothetical protein